MRLLAEIKELLGKIGSLDEELDEYITSTTQHQQKIDEFETIVDINKIEEKDKMTFLKLKEEVNSAVLKGANAKKQLQSLNSQTVVLQGGIEELRVVFSVLNVFEPVLLVLFGTFGTLSALIKNLVDALINIDPKKTEEMIKKIAYDYLTKAPGGKKFLIKLLIQK